jgi:hypothetical protein
MFSTSMGDTQSFSHFACAEQQPMRLNLFLRLCLILLVPVSLIGQADPGIYSARAFGLAGASTTLDGIDALYFNPAGLTALQHTALHGGSASNFSLGPLTQGNAGISIRAGEHSNLFASLSQFGFSSYQERQVGVGYAMQLEQTLSAAIRFDIYQFSIDGYGSAMLPGFLIGVQFQPARQIVIGAVAKNPIEIATHEAITLPTLLSIGVAFHPSQAARIYLELEKDIDYSPRVRIAAEYQVVDALVLRLGVAGNPGTFHAGFGLRVLEQLRIDLGAGYHPVLGFTPAIGFAYADLQRKTR